MVCVQSIQVSSDQFRSVAPNRIEWMIKSGKGIELLGGWLAYEVVHRQKFLNRQAQSSEFQSHPTSERNPL